eukprot:g17993.t1
MSYVHKHLCRPLVLKWVPQLQTYTTPDTPSTPSGALPAPDSRSRYRGPVSSTDLFDARGQTGCLITADGLRLKLRRGVFVPRGESRHSIRAAVRVLDELASPDLRLLDVTLGVGNVVLPLLKRYPHARAWGMDINPTAVALARENADGNGLGQQVGAFDAGAVGRAGSSLKVGSQGHSFFRWPTWPKLLWPQREGWSCKFLKRRQGSLHACCAQMDTWSSKTRLVTP